MTKKILLFFIPLLLAVPLHAQESSLLRSSQITNAAAQRIARRLAQRSPADISRLLHRNIETSYQNAVRLRGMRPEGTDRSFAYLTALPAQKLRGPLSPEYTGQLYPGLENVLTSGKQLADYFVLRNNHEMLRAERLSQKQVQKIQELLPELQASQITVFHPQSMDLTWLQQQIPPTTTLLLIGERHIIDAIQKGVASFLPLLRQRFPTREIVLFTEFLSDDTVYIPGWSKPNDTDKPYNQIWKSAMQSNIKTVGLEPAFLKQLEENLVLDIFRKQDIWSTLEGVRLRNLYWYKILQKERAKHPDALFILYAGNAHLLYNRPNSVGAALAEHETTFMVSLVPGYNKENYESKEKNALFKESWFSQRKEALKSPGVLMPVSQFDFASQAQFLDRVVQFAPKYRKLVGFDVQIKIPVSL